MRADRAPWALSLLAAGLLTLVSTGSGQVPGSADAAPANAGGRGATTTVAARASSSGGAPVTLGDEELRVGATHALVKVRPDDPVQGAASMQLHAARNEFESFQLLLRSPGGVDDVDVRVGDLRGDDARIPESAVAVYRVDTLDLRHPSSESGATGAWPDPLVPRVDRYFGERRNAFPFDLGPERTRAIWIEVYVPLDTPPGRYRGEATVYAADEMRASLPLEVQVWPFALPSTSSFDTSFGVSGLSILDAHFGRYTDDEQLYELTSLYTKAALLHRVSTHGGTMIPPRGRRVGDRWKLYWEDYDAEIGPLLAGEVLDDSDPLPGARATSVMVRTPQDLEGEDLAAYWRAWADHFEERGWLDRLFLYLWDEPQGPWQRTPFRSLNLLLARLLGEPVHEYEEVRKLAELARTADPRLVTAVTEQRIDTMAQVIDRWIPLVNCLEMKPGYPSYCEETVPREAYPAAASSHRPWFYQSCGSHGCDEPGGPYFSGWPSYMVDASAVSNRIMQWLAWRYRMGGELYHNTTRAYGVARDPWESVYVHGGNGDGTFFYPGRPDRIGGTRHIPVESLRLKLLRDGLEDFEYLSMLAELGDRETADRIAARLAPSTYGWNDDPTLLLQSRRELAERISTLLTASASAID